MLVRMLIPRIIIRTRHIIIFLIRDGMKKSFGARLTREAFHMTTVVSGMPG